MTAPITPPTPAKSTLEGQLTALLVALDTGTVGTAAAVGIPKLTTPQTAAIVAVYILAHLAVIFLQAHRSWVHVETARAQAVAAQVIPAQPALADLEPLVAQAVYAFFDKPLASVPAAPVMPPPAPDASSGAAAAAPSAAPAAAAPVSPPADAPLPPSAEPDRTVPVPVDGGHVETTLPPGSSAPTPPA